MNLLGLTSQSMSSESLWLDAAIEQDEDEDLDWDGPDDELDADENNDDEDAQFRSAIDGG